MYGHQDWPSHKALCKQLRQQRQQQPDASDVTHKGVGSSPHIVADPTAISCNMASLFQALEGQLSITRANSRSNKGALCRPNPQQRFVVRLSGILQQQPGVSVSSSSSSNSSSQG
jgi:hypothetical protein